MIKTLKPDGVLSWKPVVMAIQALAGAAEDEALWGICQERATEAVSVAQKLAADAGRELTDAALTDIAIAAVRTMDPEQDEHHLHHVLNGWLGGPANVPASLRFSWESKATVVDGATMVGDPSAWREGLKDAPSAAIPEITPERGAELMQAQNTMAAVDTAVMDAAEVYKALGRIEAAAFFARIGNISAAQFAVQVRDGKKYKGLPYKSAEGKTEHISTFDEFCEVFLGKTGRYVRDLVTNLHTLGADLYEAAEKTGFRAKDYAALKALPPDEQEAVKQALASETKEQVMDVLQDLAARHQSERQAMKKQAEDMKADLDARDKLLSDKTQKLDKVSLDLEKLKSLPPNKREILRLEQEQEAAKKLTSAVVEAQAAVNAFLLQLAEIKEAEVSAYTKEHADQTASWFCQQVQYALQENGIQADMTEIVLPEWMRDAAKQSPVDQEGR